MRHAPTFAWFAAAMLTLSACASNEQVGPAQAAGAKAGRVMDDSVLTAKVKAALIADPTTKAHQIDVETFKGVVQLSGFVDDEQARSRALEVARTVEGVRQVKDAMALREGG